MIAFKFYDRAKHYSKVQNHSRVPIVESDFRDGQVGAIAILTSLNPIIGFLLGLCS
jgi:hypothetical protein